MGHITAPSQVQPPFDDASSLSSTASISFFVILRDTSTIQELHMDLGNSFHNSLLYEYLWVKVHILDLNRILREVVVRLDDATKGRQTSTKAPSQFDVITFIFFSCVFPQILEYRPATSDCFELHSNEELH